MIIVLRLGVC